MPVEMPEGGGEDTPRGDYRILDSHLDQELEGATNVRDVQEVLIRALPSNVIFTLRFDREQYVPAIADSLIGQFAGYFNALRALPGVGAVKTFQDVTLDDQIQDAMEIYVMSTSGRTSYPIIETQFGRRLDFIAEQVAAKRAELDRIEKGG